MTDITIKRGDTYNYNILHSSTGFLRCAMIDS